MSDMIKGYDLDNTATFYKRLYKDFNLYGANINKKEKQEIEDKNKYGKVR